MTTTLPSAATLETPLKKKKVSSVRHTRAIQRDRSKRPTVAPPDDQVAERLTEIVHPATLAQLDYYRHLGLRERLLTLPVPEIAGRKPTTRRCGWWMAPPSMRWSEKSGCCAKPGLTRWRDA